MMWKKSSAKDLFLSIFLIRRIRSQTKAELLLLSASRAGREDFRLIPKPRYRTRRALALIGTLYAKTKHARRKNCFCREISRKARSFLEEGLVIRIRYG